MVAAVALVRIASELRRRAGLVVPAFSTRQIIDVCFPGTFVAGSVLPDGIDELVTERDGARLIVYSRRLPGPAQRFAIAHALAHILFDDVASAARPGRLGIPDVEARCDLFASELLVPLLELAPHVGRFPAVDPEDHELFLDQVDELASHFAVPAWVIEARIRMLAPPF